MNFATFSSVVPAPPQFWMAYRVWVSAFGEPWQSRDWRLALSGFQHAYPQVTVGQNGVVSVWVEFMAWTTSGWQPAASGFADHRQWTFGGFPRAAGDYCVV
jgi:hypothetical protein